MTQALENIGVGGSPSISWAPFYLLYAPTESGSFPLGHDIGFVGRCGFTFHPHWEHQQKKGT